MNVLVVNSSSDLYGSNRILLETMLILRPRKIILILPSCGLLTDSIIGNPDYCHVQVKIIKEMPVVFRKMSLKNKFELIKNFYIFKKAIKKINNGFSIDWAYVNTLSSFVILNILRELHVKVLLHVHEILENERFLTRLINRYSTKWADKIISVSAPVELNLKEAYKKNNTTIILNGIKDMYSPVDKNIRSAVIVSLFGRIKPEKGIWFFLEAIKLLDENTLSKARFIIVGSAAPGGDHFVEKLKKDIFTHKAKEKIQFEHFVADIRNILNNSDIIVVPSLMRDPFPTSILEAASAGKPVIATNNGGAVQSIKNNITGFLISPLNATKFAECLRVLIESKQLRNHMGKEARKFYLENFTFDIFKRNFATTVENFEE